MRLGTKTLITISSTFIGLTVALFFISQFFLLGSFKDYEERDTALNVVRAINALQGEMDNLHSLNLDWASWDDSYRFVRDSNPGFIRSNLNNETLAKQRLSVIIFLNGSNDVVFSKSIDHYSTKDTPFPWEFRPFISTQGPLSAAKQGAGQSGIIRLGGRFMIVSSRPILTSEGTGPQRGALIMGRYLDDAELMRLSSKTSLPVKLLDYEGGFFQSLSARTGRPLEGKENVMTSVASNEVIWGYGLVKDISGAPAFALGIELPRVIYRRGQASLSHFIAYLLLAALVSAAVIILLIKKTVISRVSSLSRAASEIGRTGDLSVRVPSAGTDEISALSGEVNRMLEALAALEAERRSSEDKMRKANDELEARVRERTAELSRKNVELNEEIAERGKVEEAMKEMVYHDYLTGLPNRMLFTDRLNQLIARSHRTSGSLAAVVVMGVDRFKVVNNSLGHAAGDELIKKIASTAQSSLRDSDTVARIGGDEFAILLPDIPKIEGIPAVLERVLTFLRMPVELMGHSLFITASMGVAVFPHDGGDSTTLLKNAEAAMHHAKTKGGNTFEMYDPEMARKAFERLTIGNRLRTALDREEFVLHYQPLYDLRAKRFTGAEALIRWRDPEAEGLVPPMSFIPIAEETGVITPIGEWGLLQACSFAKKVQESGYGQMSISVNISPRMFEEEGFAENVVDILKVSGLKPQDLTLEITEGLLMAHLDEAAKKISGLKGAGIRFSIDDFGTGYSSLAYLQNLSIDEIKIDRSFVMGLPSDRFIVKAIINLAHNLNLDVTAEGVETQEQLDFLVEHGCDKIQGFFLARPMPEDEFMKLMEKSQKTGKAAS